MARTPDVIIPDDIKQRPEEHEIEVAWILARHFKCVVEFLKPNNGYKIKTPDIVMNGVLWEIKSPKGATKDRTVDAQFKRALKQSRNLVMYSGRTKLSDDWIRRNIHNEILKHRRSVRVVLVTKTRKIVEF